MSFHLLWLFGLITPLIMFSLTIPSFKNGTSDGCGIYIHFLGIIFGAFFIGLGFQSVFPALLFVITFSLYSIFLALKNFKIIPKAISIATIITSLLFTGISTYYFISFLNSIIKNGYI